MAVATLVLIGLVSIGWVITLALWAWRRACTYGALPITWAMTGQCSLHRPGEVITPWPVFTASTRAALLTPQPTPFILKALGMAAFSVFFCDQERCSIQPVQANDPDHAKALVHSK